MCELKFWHIAIYCAITATVSILGIGLSLSSLYNATNLCISILFIIASSGLFMSTVHTYVILIILDSEDVKPETHMRIFIYSMIILFVAACLCTAPAWFTLFCNYMKILLLGIITAFMAIHSTIISVFYKKNEVIQPAQEVVVLNVAA